MQEALGIWGEVQSSLEEWKQQQQGQLGDLVDNTAQIDETLQLLATAKKEGVIFSRQMALLEGYLQQQVGQFASGTTYVSRTGTAVVHKGEEIVPRGQTADSSSNMQPVVVQIQGSDRLTQAIADALTPLVDDRIGRRARTVRRGGA
jgi:hypothetical protein